MRVSTRARLTAALLAMPLVIGLGGPPLGAGTLDDVKARKKLVVGIAATNEPFEFKQERKIVGYDPDIVELFGRELGVSVELVDVAFSGILGGLISRRFDMIQSAVAITSERAQRFAFSIPYAEASRVIVVKQSRGDIAGPNDLKDKTVGVELASATEKFMRNFDQELRGKGLGGLKGVNTYETLAESYLDLGIGRIDAVIDSKPHSFTMMRKKPGEFRAVAPIGQQRYFGTVFRKEDPDLLKAYNDLLTRLRKDGTLDQLQRRWFGFVFEDLPWQPVAAD